MVSLDTPPRRLRRASVLLACALTAFLAVPGGAADRQPAKIDVLHIGTSGSLASDTSGEKEKGALETLQSFIKDETGLNNDIVREKSWSELADKMAKGQFQLGVFQGYEFAWAQKKYADLKPLAVAVNVHRYPIAYVIVRRADPAKDFGGLRGKTLGLASGGGRYLNLFVERQSQAAGKKLDAFFAKVVTKENAEDALDDVVDGVIQATVVDRAALEAYKRRKPGRFNQLKPVAESKPFPPAVVVYYDKKLDDATLRRFRDGLLGAEKKERGQMMLTLFRLTGFETVPDDFAKVLAETRKNYPPAASRTE
ncbi:MAG: PhnD/SsuA/transferrin family substrate-binding protein [Planctomycetes bacterium]|nr:PhnD/SsuA/transferrin family substrate-binding protein [Planctomycetota bacterium]